MTQLTPEKFPILIEPIPGSRLVHLSVWLLSGSLHDLSGLEGTAHLLEHLMVERLEACEAIQTTGTRVNAWTSKEHTCYELIVFPEHLGVVLSATLSCLLAEPSLCRQTIEKEKLLILQEIKQAELDMHAYLSIWFNELVYGQHALAKPVAGNSESLFRIDEDDLKAFHQQHYRSDNMALGMLGEVAIQEVESLLHALPEFAALAPAPKLPRAPYHPCHHQSSRVSEQSQSMIHALIGWPSCGYQHRQRWCALLWQHIIARGKNAVLYQKLRKEARLTYDLQSGIEFYRKQGTFQIRMSLPAQAWEQLEEILRQTSLTLEDHLSSDMIQWAKFQLKMEYCLAMEQPENRVLQWIQADRGNSTESLMDRSFKAIENVNRDQLDWYRREYLLWEQHSLLLV